MIDIRSTLSMIEVIEKFVVLVSGHAFHRKLLLLNQQKPNYENASTGADNLAHEIERKPDETRQKAENS